MYLGGGRVNKFMENIKYSQSERERKSLKGLAFVSWGLLYVVAFQVPNQPIQLYSHLFSSSGCTQQKKHYFCCFNSQ